MYPGPREGICAVFLSLLHSLDYLFPHPWSSANSNLPTSFPSEHVLDLVYSPLTLFSDPICRTIPEASRSLLHILIIRTQRGSSSLLSITHELIRQSLPIGLILFTELSCNNLLQDSCCVIRILLNPLNQRTLHSLRILKNQIVKLSSLLIPPLSLPTGFYIPLIHVVGAWILPRLRTLGDFHIHSHLSFESIERRTLITLSKRFSVIGLIPIQDLID